MIFKKVQILCLWIFFLFFEYILLFQDFFLAYYKQKLFWFILLVSTVPFFGVFFIFFFFFLQLTSFKAFISYQKIKYKQRFCLFLRVLPEQKPNRFTSQVENYDYCYSPPYIYSSINSIYIYYEITVGLFPPDTKDT